METILTYLYLEIGVLVLLLSRFVAWQQIILFIKEEWQLLVGSIKSGVSFGADKDDVQHERQVSSRRAFITVLASTVGVGNLAGVSTAIHLGGPGALFWMWVSALLGMSFRMISTWLALRYQSEDKDHNSWATPMSYMDHFFADKPSLKWLPVAIAFSILVTGLLANSIQTNSVAHAMGNELGVSHLMVAIFMSLVIGIVVLSGLKRIVAMSVSIMPWIILLYVVAGLVILLSDPLKTMTVLGWVIESAFSPWSVAGGVAGYGVLQAMQLGVARGVFSHGSGLGFETFLHAANSEGVRKNALYAALVPVVDTLIICTITGLVVLSSGMWTEFNGAYLTTLSFEQFYGFGGKILVVMALILFALTTIITFSYLAERCFTYLGGKQILQFRYLFIAITFIGPFISVKFIWSIADLLIAGVLLLHLPVLIYLLLRNLNPLINEIKK